MKNKVYGKDKVHPSPPLISDHLAYLPAAILTLTAALSAEDREVLAYLISNSSNPNNNNNQKNIRTHKSTSKDDEHPSRFYCDCFRCYMSYWVKWDASPNRQLIHEIIDAFEDWLFYLDKMKTMKNKKKEKRMKRGYYCNNGTSYDIKRFEDEMSSNGGVGEMTAGSNKSKSIQMSSSSGGVDGNDNIDNDETEDGNFVISGSLSVRRFMGSIGAKIWSNVWSH